MRMKYIEILTFEEWFWKNPKTPQSFNSMESIGGFLSPNMFLADLEDSQWKESESGGQSMCRDERELSYVP